MMAAVEDTRDARERANRLLAEIGAGRITRSFAGWFLRPNPDGIWDSVGEGDQKATQELLRCGLADAGHSDTTGPGSMAPIALTDKGRAVLGTPAGSGIELPAPPPLLCDGVIHTQGELPPAVVVCAETTGGMKRMALCRDCGQRYALDAACLALAGFELDPTAPPVAIHLIPLPQNAKEGES